MPQSPFQFITHRGPQFVLHYVHTEALGASLDSGLMGKSQIQSLIAEHLKAIDELSGVETVAMIRLPVSVKGLAEIGNALIAQHGRNLVMEEKVKGWLRVWKK